jgi:GntR family transcriptional regulator
MVKGKSGKKPRETKSNAGRKKYKHETLREKLQFKFSKVASDTRIASARELATTYGVSIMTIRQALAALADDGFIYTIPGSGTFVAGEKISKRLVFVSFSQEVIDKGMKPSSKIIKAERVTIEKSELAKVLQIAVGEDAYRVTRVRLANNIPLALEESIIPCENAPGLLDQDLKGSLYEIFRTTYEKPVVRADSAVSPILLSKEQASLLKAVANTPSLRFQLTAFDARGRTMEHCVSVRRGDKYDFRFSIQA